MLSINKYSDEQLELAYERYVNEAQPMARFKEDFIEKVNTDVEYEKRWMS